MFGSPTTTTSDVPNAAELTIVRCSVAIRATLDRIVRTPSGSFSRATVQVMTRMLVCKRAVSELIVRADVSSKATETLIVRLFVASKATSEEITRANVANKAASEGIERVFVTCKAALDRMTLELV